MNILVMTLKILQLFVNVSYKNNDLKLLYLIYSVYEVEHKQSPNEENVITKSYICLLFTNILYSVIF